MAGPVSEKFAKNKHSVQPRGRLHHDRFGEFRGKMVEEHAHRATDARESFNAHARTFARDRVVRN